MKVVFYSNYLNHHQLPFCMEMYEILGDDFKFVATKPVPDERLSLGYNDLSTQYPFAINTYSNVRLYEEAFRLGEKSDVAIIGSAPRSFIKKRLESNKLTFYYMERIFKKGRHKILNPKILGNLLLNHVRYRRSFLYLLCASAYTSADFNLVGAYRDKSYKWGYFPEVKEYDLDSLIDNKKQNKVTKLLWVGRFLDWKHPDDTLKIASMLKRDKFNFSLDIIGKGPMETKLNEMIMEYNLQNEVQILGTMGPEKVREHMENANIFLFTSDFNEGWGAVLNESMNSGCAVVASHAIGSVPFLIKNKVNGLIYKNGDLDSLFNCVKSLLDNGNLQENLGRAAYETLLEEWNPKIAAERLLILSENLLNGKEFYFKEGPCSKAEIITQGFDMIDKNI